MQNVIERKIVKTSKPHVCYGCGRNIQPRTRMKRLVFKECKKLHSAYLCATCVEISKELYEQNPDGSIHFGDLHDLALIREEQEGCGML